MAKIKGDLAMIMMLFIGVTLAIVFTTQIANNVFDQTNTVTAPNETQSIVSARLAGNDVDPGTLFTVTFDQVATGNDPIDTFVLRDEQGNAATVTTDYIVNLTTGTYTLVNTSFWSQEPENTTFRSYNYKGSDYVDDSGSRLMIALILLFAALATLAFGISSVAKPGTTLGNMLRRA